MKAETLQLTDTHCHLDLEQYAPDREAVLERAWQGGLIRILVPGLDVASSVRAARLAETHPKIFAAAGVHPNDSLSWDESSLDGLQELISQHKTKIVAIGEIGLDYYWESAPHEHQMKVLESQLELAASLCLPVVLHLREQGDARGGECSQDLLRILQKWTGRLHLKGNPLAEKPGVLHSFSGSIETARAALEMKFLIGVTGPVTYKNAEAKREVVKSLPLASLLVETDGPFLAPSPQRGRRNEPAFVRHITDKIAEIQNKNPEEVAAQTTLNAARLFSWEG